MNRAGRDRCGGTFGLARFSAGNGDDLRQPRGHVEVHVEPDAGPFFAPVGAMRDGPGHVGGHREKRSVDGQHLAERFGQTGGRRPQSFCGGDGLQSFDDRLKQRRIGDTVKIGERAFAETSHGQMPLGLPRLAEIFDGSQTSQGGIEERQQMGDHHIVEKQPPVAVSVVSRRDCAYFSSMRTYLPPVICSGQFGNDSTR